MASLTRPIPLTRKNTFWHALLIKFDPAHHSQCIYVEMDNKRLNITSSMLINYSLCLQHNRLLMYQYIAIVALETKLLLTLHCIVTSTAGALVIAV